MKCDILNRKGDYYMLNKFKNASISSVIFFTFVLIFIIGALLTQSYQLTTIIIAVAFFTLVYITFTRRFYVLMPVLSIYSLLMVIADLPLVAYDMLGEDPSFIIASAPLSFFLILWLSNSSKFGELSIRNTWFANMLGMLALYLTEISLVLMDKGLSQIIIGILGFVVAFLISFCYLIFSSKSWVHKPTTPKSNNLEEKLTKSMLNDGYREVKNKKGKVLENLYVDTIEDSDYMAHLYPINEMIHTQENRREWKTFLMRKDYKDKKAYAWLYQIAVATSEKRHKEKPKRELPIIVESVDSPDEHGKFNIIEIPIPRSSKTYMIGILTLCEKEKQNRKNFDKLFLSMRIKAQEEK